MSRPITEITRDLAAIIAAKKIVAEAEEGAKAELREALPRGTAYATDDQGEPLGTATVPKSSTPSPTAAIEDEARVLPWATELFGDGIATLRLTEQGRASVIAFALAEHKDAGSPSRYYGVEGVAVAVPARKTPTASFTPEKNVVELVRGMVSRGALSLTDVLAIEGAK